jgi:hypothetical protein
MDTDLRISSDSSRGLLFGLLVNCLFPTTSQKSCPLWNLRTNLTIEKKYDYVMGLSKEEVAHILEQHEECYEKRFTGFYQE